MERAVYPGSFDPVTYGHLDIIQRASSIFDELIVAVAVNLDKDPLFSAEERVDMIRELTKDVPNVIVDSFDGMTVDYVRARDSRIIIRGMRTMSDFENELQLALGNRAMAPNIETILLVTSGRYSYFSSHRIKEIVALGGNAGYAVPDFIQERMRKKLRRE